MRIIFVHPPLTLKERYGVDHQSGGETTPLGLCYLAAAAREAGYDVNIVDAEILGYGKDTAVREILKLNPDVVGFTAVTISVDNAAAVASEIKKARPEIITLIGGHHLTTVPEETMRLYPEFDIGVIGEGEETVRELLKVLNEHRLNYEKLKNVNGLIFKNNFESQNFFKDDISKTNNKNNDYFFTPTRFRNLKLDSLPYPAFDLLPDLKLYSPPAHTVKKFPAVNLVTSRGCPGQCVFCTRSVYGNVLSHHSAKYMLDLVKWLYNDYGIREIQFRDDNFTVFKPRLHEFCEMLQREKLNLSWTALARVDMVDLKMLKAMKAAGCWQVWYGIESGNEEILRLIKKNTNKTQIRNAVNWTKESGMDVGAFFIIGHPGETSATIKETINLALSLPIDEFHCSFMTPLPGAELYRIWEKYGVFENNWKNLNGWLPVFTPYGLTKEELERYNKMFFRKFYFRPRIVLNYLKRIRSFHHFKVYFKGFLALTEWIIRRRKSSTN